MVGNLPKVAKDEVMLQEDLVEKFKDMGLDTDLLYIKIGKNHISIHDGYIKIIKKGLVVQTIDTRFIDCIKETEKSIIVYCCKYACYKKVIRKF